MPPRELPVADIDEDSDKSDDEVEGELIHLPRRISLAESEVENSAPVSCVAALLTEIDAANDSESLWDSCDEMPLAQICDAKLPNYKYENIWRNKESEMKVPDFQHSYSPRSFDLPKGTIKHPMDAFAYFLTNEFVSHIALQSNLYAHQKGHDLNLKEDELLCFFGVLVLSGYNRRPQKYCYWSTEPDLECPLVA